METPAYDVLRLKSENYSAKEIIQICEKKYGDEESDIFNFVHQIIESIETLNTPGEKVLRGSKHQLECMPEPYKVVHYKFGDKNIAISYGNHSIYEEFYHLFKHLEVDKTTIFNSITLLEKDNQLFFVDSKNSVTRFLSDEMEYFKGAVLKYLCALLYDKDPDSWMMTIHASGIIKNNEAILFVASEGSGKSTIAALLKAQGYQHLSDDLVVVDQNSKTFPFPAGISVKKGAIKVLQSYYPEILNQKENSNQNKPARFIPNHILEPYGKEGGNIKAVIFVEYDAERSFKFEAVDKKVALQKYLKETWVNPDVENVKLFFEWIKNTSFYELRYSNIKQVTNEIIRIFEG